MNCGRYPGTPCIQEICILSSIYVLHFFNISHFFCYQCPLQLFLLPVSFLHSLILLFSSCTPSFFSFCLSLSCISCFLLFPFSKLIKERVLVGNPVGEKNQYSHTKIKISFILQFLLLSFSLFLLLPFL